MPSPTWSGLGLDPNPNPDLTLTLTLKLKPKPYAYQVGGYAPSATQQRTSGTSGSDGGGGDSQRTEGGGGDNRRVSLRTKSLRARASSNLNPGSTLLAFALSLISWPSPCSPGPNPQVLTLNPNLKA